MSDAIKVVGSPVSGGSIRQQSPELKVAAVALATPANAAKTAIQRFMTRQEYLEGVILASVDGLIIASVMRESGPTSKLAAMASALLGLCDAAAAESAIGESEQLVIEARDGRLVVMTLRLEGKPCVLMTIAGPAQSLGKIIWAARQCRTLVEASC